MQDKNLQDQLMRMRREAEERDAKRLANNYNISYLSLSDISVDLDALVVVPKTRAIESNFATIEMAGKKIVAVMSDPGFSKTKDIIKELESKGFTVKKYVVSENSLNYVFSHYRFVRAKSNSIVGSIKISSQNNAYSEESITADMLDTIAKVKEEASKYNNLGYITTLMRIILLGAIKNRASDIHIEPAKGSARIRYRIDGMLSDIFTELNVNVYSLLILRIKLLSKLKLNIKGDPQDGRFTINLLKKDIEVRVAIAPTEFGEVAVMRILDPDSISVSLEALGFRKDDLNSIKNELAKPNGMILNTGPTGSGKTTTLYAFLRYKNNSQIKIITIEDPIEYHINGIEQTQVDKESGYTFASGLRSLMRQDPDVLLVGEIRDNETAQIAVQSALTGHLLFSTIHANSAVGAIPRLLNLGVKPTTLAPALSMIIAQRLVRKLCKCKEKVEISEETRKKIEVYVNSIPDRVDKKSILKNISIFKPKKCEECNWTGYKGRIAIFELLNITPSIQSLIIKNLGQIEIQKEVDKTDFVTMQEDGVLKILSGITTFEEVERVSGKIDLNISKN